MLEGTVSKNALPKQRKGTDVLFDYTTQVDPKPDATKPALAKSLVPF